MEEDDEKDEKQEQNVNAKFQKDITNEEKQKINNNELKTINNGIDSASSTKLTDMKSKNSVKSETICSKVVAIPSTSKTTNLSSKPPSRQEAVLKTFKSKLKEEKQKRQEYKEHFKQMIQENNDVFLLPHHISHQQEFIIKESKD